MSQVARLAALVLTCAVVAACGGSDEPTRTVEPWPEADALFHQDPRWRGADDAFSVDLGRERVLWLFADTVVATSPANTRAESCVVRNSIGLMDGMDPASATMTFRWGVSARGMPESFIPLGVDQCYGGRDNAWFWPGDGERLGVDGPLLIFLLRIRHNPAEAPPWDFRGDGWSAVRVPNPDADPSVWRIEPVVVPRDRWNIMLGSGSVLVQDDWLYAFGTRGDVHDVYLARWRVVSAAAGDLESPEWWAGEARGFVAQSELDGEPQVLFEDGPAEFTVHEGDGGFVLVQTVGFGAAHLGVRTAPSLTGPWSAVRDLWSPPEARREGALIYAGKAHPELDADGAVAVTYIPSDFDVSTILADESLYYPRFVRLRLEP